MSVLEKKNNSLYLRFPSDLLSLALNKATYNHCIRSAWEVAYVNLDRCLLLPSTSISCQRTKKPSCVWASPFTSSGSCRMSIQIKLQTWSLILDASSIRDLVGKDKLMWLAKLALHIHFRLSVLHGKWDVTLSLQELQSGTSNSVWLLPSPVPHGLFGATSYCHASG